MLPLGPRGNHNLRLISSQITLAKSRSTGRGFAFFYWIRPSLSVVRGVALPCYMFHQLQKLLL